MHKTDQIVESWLIGQQFIFISLRHEGLAVLLQAENSWILTCAQLSTNLQNVPHGHTAARFRRERSTRKKPH